MTIDFSPFKTLIPSRFETLFLPNTLINRCYLQSLELRIAVLDSPEATADDDSPFIVALIVPERRERFWTFCTESGHLQLLFGISNKISRLILIGNTFDPNSVQPSTYTRPPPVDQVDLDNLESELEPLVLDLHPTVCFRDGRPKPFFWKYEDELVYCVTLERCVGPSVAEFDVLDVEYQSNHITRMLRFKRMPNLIQSQVVLIPKYADGDDEAGLGGLALETLRNIEGVEFLFDSKASLHPYMAPMVSGLFLIASPLYEQIKQGYRPRALCLGVGGGTLLLFLHSILGCEVVGVEIDEAVLSAARKYFGLPQDLPSFKLIVGDAIELIQKVADDPSVIVDGLNDKFDVVMVDLDSNVAGTRTTAPPLEFVSKPVVEAMKSRLHDHGVLVINVITLDKLFYERLIQMLQDVFNQLYEIVVKEDEKFILMATLTPRASNDLANTFLERLISVIPWSSIDSLQEL